MNVAGQGTIVPNSISQVGSSGGLAGSSSVENGVNAASSPLSPSGAAQKPVVQATSLTPSAAMVAGYNVRQPVLAPNSQIPKSTALQDPPDSSLLAKAGLVVSSGKPVNSQVMGTSLTGPVMNMPQGTIRQVVPYDQGTQGVVGQSCYTQPQPQVFNQYPAHTDGTPIHNYASGQGSSVYEDISPLSSRVGPMLRHNPPRQPPYTKPVGFATRPGSLAGAQQMQLQPAQGSILKGTPVFRKQQPSAGYVNNRMHSESIQGHNMPSSGYGQTMSAQGIAGVQNMMPEPVAPVHFSLAEMHWVRFFSYDTATPIYRSLR